MKGCGCFLALVLLVLAFNFGPWAVLGWILVVLVVIATVNMFSSDGDSEYSRLLNERNRDKPKPNSEVWDEWIRQSKSDK